MAFPELGLIQETTQEREKTKPCLRAKDKGVNGGNVRLPASKAVTVGGAGMKTQAQQALNQLMLRQ